MLLLSAVFFILLTCWVLWAWIIAESRDFRLMKVWCARVFVVLAAMMCFGIGAWYGNRKNDHQHRESVTHLIQLLHERTQSGQMDDVAAAIRHVAETPDEWSLHSPDILARVGEVSEALEKSGRTAVAEHAPDSGTRTE